MVSSASHLRPATVSANRHLIALLLGVCLLCFAPLSAMAANCYKLYSGGQLGPAADCFALEGKSLGTGKLGAATRFKKGRLLQNAIVLYSQAAKKASGPAATKLRLKGIQLFNVYRTERLHDNRAKLRQLSKLVSDMRRKVGFATLTILANHKQAKICVSGNLFQKCKTANTWTLRIQPGSFTIKLTYPLSPPVQKQQEVKLAPNQKLTKIFFPPVKKDGQLSVIANHPQTRMILAGGKLSTPKTHTGPFWALTLTQGTYKLQIIYPKMKPIIKTIEIKAGKTQTVMTNPPPPPVLNIVSVPRDARVFINGRYLGKTPFRQKIDVGTYNIELQKGCYLTATRSLKVSGDKAMDIKFSLKRDPVHQQWQQRKKTAPGKQIIGWTTIAAGVVLGAGSVFLNVLANNEHTLAQNARPYDFEEFKSRGEQGNTFRTLGLAGGVAGTASLGFGIYSLVTAFPAPEYRLPCKNKMELWRIE
ncbi:MAG TPA: hypothetical protein DCE42_01125 [Myxococcales bacterium]|nr:hypothetical protein [Deltaproteobacteria bacterium]MBU51451.1 hypothetical protein [Deltaproteobacteria bacterium]HAA53323.1 hypothetical protein [Myxococcales bacterium]